MGKVLSSWFGCILENVFSFYLRHSALDKDPVHVKVTLQRQVHIVHSQHYLFVVGLAHFN